MEKIPIECDVTVDTALVIVKLAHEKFNDSMGKAVDFLASEYRSHYPTPEPSLPTVGTP